MCDADGVRKTKGRRDYLAYLLRLWRAGSGESAAWRASLQDPHTRERMEFACLDDAVAFLEQRMSEAQAGPGTGVDGEFAPQ